LFFIGIKGHLLHSLQINFTSNVVHFWIYNLCTTTYMSLLYIETLELVLNITLSLVWFRNYSKFNFTVFRIFMWRWRVRKNV